MIQRVDAVAVRDLRARVLRPGAPLEASVYPEDDEPRTVHLASIDDDDAVVGCVSIFPEAWGDVPGAYRLRGMATAEHTRGGGHGVALLRAAIDAATDAGAPLLWCNARVSAEGFYAANGFVVVGEVFEVAGAGPHKVMTRRLDAAAP